MTPVGNKKGRNYSWFHLALVAIWSLLVHGSSLRIWFDWETVRFFIIPRPGRFKGLEPFWSNWIDLSDYGIVVASQTLRPLMSLLFQIQTILFSDAAWLYHINNLLVHILCAWALYFFTARLGFTPVMRVLTALLFTSHPLATQPLWILGDTAEQYVLLGGLLALIFYHRHTGIALTAMTGALLSKETAVTIPLWLFFFDIFFVTERVRGKRDILSLVKRQTPYWLVLVLYIGYRAVVFRGMGGYHAMDEIGISNFFSVFNQNIAWLLTVAHGGKITAILSILFLCLVFMPRVHCSVRFGVLWMGAYLLPVSNLCNKWYLYTAIAVFVTVLTGLASKLLKIKRFRFGTVLVMLLAAVYGSVLSFGELEFQRRNAAVAPRLARQCREIIRSREVPKQITFYWCHTTAFRELGGHWVDYETYLLKSEKTPLEATVWDLNATRFLPDGTPVWNRSVEAAIRLEYNDYMRPNVSLKRVGEAATGTEDFVLDMGYSPPELYQSGRYPCASP